MISNEELFHKMMRFQRMAHMKRFRPEAGNGQEGCGRPPMPPHCGKGPHGKGPHGPHGQHRGMTRERLLVLMAQRPEGMWQKDLAWEADINASSASELTGRLEQDGYLTREVDENDRRAVLLKLTEAGMQRAEELQAEQESYLEGLFAKLSQEEKQNLSDLLDKLLN